MYQQPLTVAIARKARCYTFQYEIFGHVHPSFNSKHPYLFILDSKVIPNIGWPCKYQTGARLSQNLISQSNITGSFLKSDIKYQPQKSCCKLFSSMTKHPLYFLNYRSGKGGE